MSIRMDQDAYLYEKEKERQFRLQIEQLKQNHQMELAKKAAADQQVNHYPSNQELVARIMEMQRKYITRLEIENERLTKALEERKDGG